MKSYGSLYTKFISDDNIRLAMQRAARGKKNRKNRDKLRYIRDHADEYIPRVRHYAEHFKNSEHAPIQMYDGIAHKTRTILVPTPMEQIVHHMIINIMQPIFMKGMYAHSVGSIPGRGGYKGKKYLEKHTRSRSRDVKYVLKTDIRKFFDTIPHDKLKERLDKVIRDKRFLHVLYTLIDIQEQGLPLGFYTSQWLANWYLQPLDHFIKEDLHIKVYIRYMDDKVMTGSNKKELHRARFRISEFLQEKLGLTLKDNWQVYRFNVGKKKYRDIDFMGYRFYRDRTTLRKTILLHAKRCALKIWKEISPRLFLIRRMLSYLGWLKHTDTYNVFQNYVKPFVNVRRCKRRVSSYDRRRNKLCLVA